jgi:hypothetical protein
LSVGCTAHGLDWVLAIKVFRAKCTEQTATGDLFWTGCPAIIPADADVIETTVNHLGHSVSWTNWIGSSTRKRLVVEVAIIIFIIAGTIFICILAWLSTTAFACCTGFAAAFTCCTGFAATCTCCACFTADACCIVAYFEVINRIACKQK